MHLRYVQLVSATIEFRRVLVVPRRVRSFGGLKMVAGKDTAKTHLTVSTTANLATPAEKKRK